MLDVIQKSMMNRSRKHSMNKPKIVWKRFSCERYGTTVFFYCFKYRNNIHFYCFSYIDFQPANRWICIIFDWIPSDIEFVEHWEPRWIQPYQSSIWNGSDQMGNVENHSKWDRTTKRKYNGWLDGCHHCGHGLFWKLRVCSVAIFVNSHKISPKYFLICFPFFLSLGLTNVRKRFCCSQHSPQKWMVQI